MLFYTDVPGATQTTNAAANTPNDCFFIKPGAARTCWLRAIYVVGRAVGRSTISGNTLRLEKWFTTSSSAGTAITPSPNSAGYQAAKHTAGFSAATVTSGTGGPTLMLSIGFGVTSPGNWVAPSASLEDAYDLEAGANNSLDIFNVSGDTAIPFEMSTGTVE